MKRLHRLFAAVNVIIAALFGAASLLLIAVAVRLFWLGALSIGEQSHAGLIVEGVGLLAVALVALEIAQTVIEEEVVREMHVSAPTRVRRFLSRFLVVVVVALSIESLVATFKLLHEEPSGLPYAASVALGAAALLAGWGVFIRLNRAAEELEPEAMEEAKEEDRKLE